MGYFSYVLNQICLILLKSNKLLRVGFIESDYIHLVSKKKDYIHL
jgi:hypothetical protein